MSAPLVHIIEASTPEHYDHFRALILEYQVELGKDLTFQDFEQELKHLPAWYGPPNTIGLLLWDENTDQCVGCVGLKDLKEGRSEMKRLYVKPTYRAYGYGKLLVERLLSEAIKLGFSTMVLDTLRELEPAIRLYKKMGFREIEPYYFNPYDDVVFMQIDFET